MRWVVIVALAAWSLLGSPLNDVASFLWPNDAAPWEKVDAYFYPNRANLFVHWVSRDVRSLDGCRAWVRDMAAMVNDPQIRRGDYECGVGEIRNLGDVTIYRLTIR